MSQFSKKLAKNYPVVERHYRISRNGIVKKFISLKSGDIGMEKKATVPYVKDAELFLQERNGLLAEYILLVTESENIAAKVALLLKESAREFMMDDDDYQLLFGDDEYDDDDYTEYDKENSNDSEWLRVISLKTPVLQDKGGLNGYVPYLSEVSNSDIVLFTGITDCQHLEEKIEVIGACGAQTMFVHVTPEQLSLPWVQDLCVNYDCDKLIINALPETYYESVVKTLLEGESYKLGKDLSVDMLVHRIKKKRGCKFQEEDVAWYLSEARKHARQNQKRSALLKKSDFPMLFTNKKNPMDCLMNMTGMESVKEMAKEFAAVVQEEISNKKLGMLHKNMIFLGNPGTGKTSCASLLAEVMAEEGNTNANFVVATRKDLIGEYVGQTAPKVAARFEEARGGILFVDEAGFFLNMNAGGFVQEAVKEFVRYMENYPDVTVIFAMYANEAAAFLELDPGLSSRISRLVNFEDYKDEELCQILVGMLMEKGYTLEEDAKEEVIAYMQKLRKEKKKNFGNAREARKLAESAIIAACVQKYQRKKEHFVITKEDIVNGMKRLQQEATKRTEKFGFGCVENNRKVQHYGA